MIPTNPVFLGTLAAVILLDGTLLATLALPEEQSGDAYRRYKKRHPRFLVFNVVTCQSSFLVCRAISKSPRQVALRDTEEPLRREATPSKRSFAPLKMTCR
jgi:DNA-binding NarL/FixJ family response regulator